MMRNLGPGGFETHELESLEVRSSGAVVYAGAARVVVDVPGLDGAVRWYALLRDVPAEISAQIARYPLDRFDLATGAGVIGEARAEGTEARGAVLRLEGAGGINVAALSSV
jgi:hypothetical protein